MMKDHWLSPQSKRMPSHRWLGWPIARWRLQEITPQASVPTTNTTIYSILAPGTRRRLTRILEGDVAGIVRGLRAALTCRRVRGEPRKQLLRICNYLASNAARMRFDECLSAGYPIASGVIEGACRHLVKDRMERSGMCWTLEGARSMLNVRAAFQSSYWDQFPSNRIARNKRPSIPTAHCSAITPRSN